MPIAVQQTLHGYNDGHRLIAGSVMPGGAAARIMLAMSDLSGQGVKPDREGYLTGYPLEGTGLYVLARTWAAPEMPRPGCVWTHSLLVENADLAALGSADPLLAAFRRPSGPAASSEFSSPLGLDLMEVAPEPLSSPRLHELVNALYAAPDRVIVAEAGGRESDEAMVLALWMQQWPRLRRGFGFCTLSGADRSSKGAALDLHLVRAPERQARSKFVNSIMPSDAPIDPDLHALLQDLSGRPATQIREFLRRAGGDVEGGRRAMSPLCRLHAALFETSPPNLSSAIQVLGELDAFGSRQARTVRAVVAQRAMADLDRADDTVLTFLIEELEATGSSGDEALIAPLGRALWRRWPERFMRTWLDKGPLQNACAIALGSMPVDEIVTGLERSELELRPFVEARPDLMKRAGFWRLQGSEDDFIEIVADEALPHIAVALAVAGRGGPATTVVARADPGLLVGSLEAAEVDWAILVVWLTALARRPEALGAALASKRIRQRKTLALLAAVSDPDSVPNDQGDDPWVTAFRASQGELSDRESDALCAYLLSRALGWRSRSSAELLKFTYARVYVALAMSRLSAVADAQVSRRLDWTWPLWDRCARLRETVARKFVDGDWDATIFGRLVDDGALMTALFDEVARSGRGRRYLEDVRRRLKDDPDPALRARAEHIDRRLRFLPG